MKTILRTSGVLLLVFAVALAQAQSKSYRMYDAFSNKEGVTNFSFSKNMIDAIDLDLGENGDEKQVKGDLHEIRFMSYNPEKGQWSGTDFMKKALTQLVNHDF